jgi:hypothetical protein
LQRVDERRISIEDLQTLRTWVRTGPSRPDGGGYKDFGSSLLCGTGTLSKTVLEKGLKPFGDPIE